MNQSLIPDIEKHLSFALSVFQETPDTHKGMYLVRDYMLKYCFEKNLNIDETLEVVNPTLSEHKKLTKDSIIPKSKRSKVFFIQTTLFDLISDNGVLFSDEEKRQDIISKFCKLTEFDSEFVNNIINSRIRYEKRKLIETDLYNAIMKTSNKNQNKSFRQEIKDIVLEFSEAIDTTPEYTLGVLTRKIKSEKQKKLSDSNDSNDAR